MWSREAARRQGGKAASGCARQHRPCKEGLESVAFPGVVLSDRRFSLAALPPCRLAASGFTLIELLVVITVLAILASLVSPMVFRNVGDAKVTAVKSQLEILSLALDSYRLDNDYYPSTAQGLTALVAAPSGEPVARNWRGPYLKRGVPSDPWGRPYLYRSPARGADDYEVSSLGRDGQPGGSGEDADLSTAEPFAAPARP